MADMLANPLITLHGLRSIDYSIVSEGLLSSVLYYIYEWNWLFANQMWIEKKLLLLIWKRGW